VGAITSERRAASDRNGWAAYVGIRSQAHDDPAQLVFFETWASQDALDAHIGAPHTKVWFEGTKDTALAPSAITKLVIISDMAASKPG